MSFLAGSAESDGDGAEQSGSTQSADVRKAGTTQAGGQEGRSGLAKLSRGGGGDTGLDSLAGVGGGEPLRLETEDRAVASPSSLETVVVLPIPHWLELAKGEPLCMVESGGRSHGLAELTLSA